MAEHEKGIKFVVTGVLGELDEIGGVKKRFESGKFNFQRDFSEF